MDDRRVQIVMEMVKRRREELAEAKAKSTPASSRQNDDSTFIQILEKRQAQHEHVNPFREPDKRFGGGQRKKKKKKSYSEQEIVFQRFITLKELREAPKRINKGDL